MKVEMLVTLKASKIWNKGLVLEAPFHPDIQKEIANKTGVCKVVGEDMATTGEPQKRPITWTKTSLMLLKKDELGVLLKPFHDIENLDGLNRQERLQLCLDRYLGVSEVVVTDDEPPV